MQRFIKVSFFISSLAIAAPGFAADGPFTPAPVPQLGGQRILPPARTGPDIGPSTVDTPFSGVPLGSVAADGSTSSNTINGVQTPDLSGK